MFKVNNKDTRTTPMAFFSVLIVNFEHISHLVLVYLFLTLNMQLPAGMHNIFEINKSKIFKKSAIFSKSLNHPILDLFKKNYFEHGKNV